MRRECPFLDSGSQWYETLCTVNATCFDSALPSDPIQIGSEAIPVWRRKFPWHFANRWYRDERAFIRSI
jgi:hypothetical protein